MSHPVRLTLALFFLAMTAHHVRRGDAFFAALNASCATHWLWSWMEDA